MSRSDTFQTSESFIDASTRPGLDLPMPSLKEIQSLGFQNALPSELANISNPLGSMGFPSLSIVGDLSNASMMQAHLPQPEKMLQSVMSMLPNIGDPRLPFSQQSDSRTDKNTVTVRPGDTLWKIANKALSSEGQAPSTKQIENMVNEIARKNGIKDPNKISAGERLQLPATERTGYQPNDLARRTGSNTTRPDNACNGDSPAISDRPNRRPNTREDIARNATASNADTARDAEVLSRHFDSIDRDKDDRISKEELERYTRKLEKQLAYEKDPEKVKTLTNDIRSLNRMNERHESVQNASNDDFGAENGISRRDLKKFSEDADKKTAELRKVEEESAVMTRLFGTIDKDGNDRVSREELTQHLKDMAEQAARESDPLKRQQLKKDMEVLTRIEKDFDGIQRASNDGFWGDNGISRRDLHVRLRNAEGRPIVDEQKEEPIFGSQKGGWHYIEKTRPFAKTEDCKTYPAEWELLLKELRAIKRDK